MARRPKAFDHSKYANWIDPAKVVPYERNAKQHTEKQIKNLVNSINRFGWQQDVVITSDNVLVIGHGRRLAALQIGCDMPYHVIDKTADALTDADIRELRIADNQTNAETGMDFSALEAEIEDLSFDGFDFDFGFDFDDEEEPAEIVEDEVPKEVETRCKLGDIWQLGTHRPICGDSTDPAVIDRLMDGVKADMVFTDPPYNVDYSNADRPKPSKTNLGKIKNDVMGEDDFIYFLGEVYKRLDENTKTDSSFYIWYADKSTIAFYSALYETNINFNQMIIWKKPMLLGRNRYQYAHEPCIFAVKGSPYFTEDRTKTTVWDFGGYDKSKNVHPTQKPFFLPSEALKNSSREGDAILDVFGGSGSTLIACEQLNRKCYMCELDPHYCDVIIQRWENLTGKKAVMLNV